MSRPQTARAHLAGVPDDGLGRMDYGSSMKTGSTAGAAVGGAIGACFAGVGSVPGAAVGAAIGTLIGLFTAFSQRNYVRGDEKARFLQDAYKAAWNVPPDPAILKGLMATASIHVDTLGARVQQRTFAPYNVGLWTGNVLDVYKGLAGIFRERFNREGADAEYKFWAAYPDLANKDWRDLGWLASERMLPHEDRVKSLVRATIGTPTDQDMRYWSTYVIEHPGVSDAAVTAEMKRLAAASGTPIQPAPTKTPPAISFKSGGLAPATKPPSAADFRKTTAQPAVPAPSAPPTAQPPAAKSPAASASGGGATALALAGAGFLVGGPVGAAVGLVAGLVMQPKAASVSGLAGLEAAAAASRATSAAPRSRSAGRGIASVRQLADKAHACGDRLRFSVREVPMDGGGIRQYETCAWNRQALVSSLERTGWIVA